MKDYARIMKFHLERIMNYLSSQDHRCKGRKDQSKDSTNGKDGVWIKKYGAPENCHIFQVR